MSFGNRTNIGVVVGSTKTVGWAPVVPVVPLLPKEAKGDDSAGDIRTEGDPSKGEDGRGLSDTDDAEVEITEADDRDLSGSGQNAISWSGRHNVRESFDSVRDVEGASRIENRRILQDVIGSCRTGK